MSSMSSSKLVHGHDDRWLSVTKPTGFTTWWRTCIPWQLVRFVLINLRMFRLISRGHH